MKSSRPSDTARLIAQSTLLASRDHKLKQLVPEDAPRLLEKILDADGRRDWIGSLGRFGLTRWFLFKLEALLLRGIIAHYLVRKRQIESLVEESIRNGCKRVVIVGAGFDLLAFRLARKYPDVAIEELDHPATQQVKAGALEDLPNLSFSPIDLVGQLPSEVLRSGGETGQGPAAIVMEGLLMYFKEGRVSELLKDAAKIAGPTGRVIFTFMERDERGSIGFRGESSLIGRWLNARSEPFLWGISRVELPGFLVPADLGEIELFDHDDLRCGHWAPLGLQEIPLAKGELVCKCSH